MALDLGTMTKYTDEMSGALIKEAVLTGRTVDMVTVQGGVKHSATVNRLSSALQAQAGTCGWNPQGTTTLDQRAIEVSPIKINEPICLNDLEEYYTSTMMNPGSYNEEIPFEQIFAENKRDAVKSLIEDLIWKGNTDTGTGNLALANGFIKLFDAAETAGDLTRVGTYTIANFATDAIDIVDEAIAKLPDAVLGLDDLVVMISYADYRKYAKAVRDANLFHYTGAENQGEDFMQIHPGTNVKVVATKGLSGTNRFVVTPASNLVVGTDLLDDAEDFRIFYSQDNDEVRFLAKFKIGVQVAFIENVVWYTGS